MDMCAYISLCTMTWHRGDDLPNVNERVVGLFDDGAEICYMNINGQWIDLKHGCYCYTQPLMWTALPKEYII